MKKLIIILSISLALLVGLSYALTYESDSSKCKKTLIGIGDAYSRYVIAMKEYDEITDKDSDYAKQKKEYAYSNGNYSIFFLRQLPDLYDDDLIERCLQKLSFEERQNFLDAKSYYEDNIDAINKAYETSGS